MNKSETKSLLLSGREAARLLGVCVSHLRQLHNSGRLGPLPVRLGRRALWNRKELEAWVESDCPARQRWQESKKIKPRAKSA